MKIEDVKKIFSSRYPQWNVYYEESGKAIWISINDGDIHFFEIQVTPDQGVGVSVKRNSEELDFAGHDEVFDSLDKALNYVDEMLS